MAWVKMIDKKRFFWLLVFILLFLLTRIPNLSRDTINPDAVNWHYRSEQFVVGLKHSIFEKTYQHYHPGVTLMWLTGVPIEIYKQVSNVTTYDQFSFHAFHFVAKYSLVITQLVLSLIVLFWLSKVLKFKKAWLTVFIFSFEPFFIGNSRLFHMDIIFALFVFAALITSHIHIKEEKWYWAALTGFLCGLAFLTRSVGLGVWLFVLGVGGGFLYLKTKDIAKVVKFCLITSAAFIITTFALFPALWDRPVEVITNIFTEGERIGIRKGHGQIVFGEYTRNAGLLFYPLVLLLKLSPFIILGILSYFAAMVEIFKTKQTVKEIIILKNERIVGIISYMLIFFTGYFLVMTFPSKKIDRYMLILFPYFGLLASFGFLYLFEKLKPIFQQTQGLLILLFIAFVVVPNIQAHPYQFTYTNPLLGSVSSANGIIAQKPFGIGMYEVKEHLQTKYGSAVEVGFIDTKPIKSIYPNSLVSDIRVNGVSDYDVMVLAINEVAPEKVLESEVKFTKDSSIFINDLEYWRFYVKESK